MANLRHGRRRRQAAQYSVALTTDTACPAARVQTVPAVRAVGADAEAALEGPPRGAAALAEAAGSDPRTATVAHGGTKAKLDRALVVDCPVPVVADGDDSGTRFGCGTVATDGRPSRLSQPLFDGGQIPALQHLGS
jgi:hypothetical protein